MKLHSHYFVLYRLLDYNYSKRGDNILSRKEKFEKFELAMKNFDTYIHQHRDFFNYLLQSKRHHKWHRKISINFRQACYHIFRSSRFTKLAPKQILLLKHLHIINIVDLREKRNRLNETDYGENVDYIYGTNIKYYYYPIYTLKERFRNHKDNQFDDVYGKQALNSKQAIFAYRHIFQLLLNSNHGTVFTCDAGKDRTGVVITLIMLILGYSKKDVINEYLLSGIIVPTNPKYIIHFLNTLSNQYNNASNYVIKKKILNKNQIKMLQEKYRK